MNFETLCIFDKCISVNLIYSITYSRLLKHDNVSALCRACKFPSFPFFLSFLGFPEIFIFMHFLRTLQGSPLQGPPLLSSVFLNRKIIVPILNFDKFGRSAFAISLYLHSVQFIIWQCFYLMFKTYYMIIYYRLKFWMFRGLVLLNLALSKYSKLFHLKDA